MIRGRATALALVVLFASACGRGDDSASPGDPSPTAASPTTGRTAAGPPSSAPGSPSEQGAPVATGTGPARTVVPDVVLRNVNSGADVKLRALGLPERPTLYWFWAPH